ncbi:MULTISPECIES: hypothetical protein [Metabacillus]|uniref:Uncharacterized protein n=2 Tax=Metabacillus TaxID=2675233 RepID=A0A179SL68_9BACI|nr:MULTISPECIES: hypothetical protein [Metabacillus]OAS82435.1 hypothetical protein A6K24_12310 [Metabacillus litoralis]QNF26621.1 hypothetical protein HUW50_03105 [Metabacillus sp. KUDC1714]
MEGMRWCGFVVMNVMRSSYNSSEIVQEVNDLGLKKLLSLKNVSLVKQVNQIQSEKLYGGIIHQLKLDDFWHQLKGYERAFLRNCTKWSFGGKIKSEEFDHTDSNVKTKRSDCSFLFGLASWSYESKEYELTEKILMEIVNRAFTPIMIHRAYQELIKMHYLLRENDEASMQKCKVYCKLHIELAPILLKTASNEGIRPPRIPAFVILSNVLKEEGRLEECEEVLMLGHQYKIGKFDY